MVYHPEERNEILMKRIRVELRHKTYYPKPVHSKPLVASPTPLYLRLEKLRKMKEEKKSRLSFIDDFLDSEENQKKYGFTTEVVNGIRSIYYDGDINLLNEAMYGAQAMPAYPEINSERALHLYEQDDKLYARIPHKDDKDEDIPVKIRIGTEDSEAPNFAIVSEKDDAKLTQLCLTDPAYFPTESDCLYILDLRGLSVLNRYVRNNFIRMIEEWNNLHPTDKLATDIPLPNYRFLASAAYATAKRNHL